MRLALVVEEVLTIIILFIKNYQTMNNNTQLAAAFTAYLQAHKALSTAWSESGHGDKFSRLYPFADSFDDMTSNIELWVNDAVSRLNTASGNLIEQIIARKKQGIDCTEEESANIKGFVKDTLLAINSWEIQAVEDIQLLFPLEYGEAIDEQSAKTFLWSDKSGRGETAAVLFTNIGFDEEEVNYDGITLYEWAENATQGEEWENATDKYICTKS